MLCIELIPLSGRSSLIAADAGQETPPSGDDDADLTAALIHNAFLSRHNASVHDFPFQPPNARADLKEGSKINQPPSAANKEPGSPRKNGKSNGAGLDTRPKASNGVARPVAPAGEASILRLLLVEMRADLEPVLKHIPPIWRRRIYAGTVGVATVVGSVVQGALGPMLVPASKMLSLLAKGVRRAAAHLQQAAGRLEQRAEDMVR